MSDEPFDEVAQTMPSERSSNKEYAHFLNIAEGSLAESEYLLLYLAADLGYLTPPQRGPLLAEVDEIARMLHVLRSKVEQSDTGEQDS